MLLEIPNENYLESITMKHVFKDLLLTAMVFFLITILVSEHANAASGFPDGMVAYWKLDGAAGATSFSDASPLGGHPAQCGGDCPGRDEGVVGYTRVFDGISDGLLVPASQDLDWGGGDSFSIELWVKRDNSTLTGEEVLIGRVDDATAMQWQIKIQSSGRVAFDLLDANGSGVTLSSGSGKVLTETVGSEGAPRWHHVAVVRDGAQNETFLYVDGEQEANLPFTYQQGFSSATGGVTIGWLDAAQEARFDGSLDEIAIYNAALDEADIRGHYFLARAYGDLHATKVRIMPLGDSITEDDYTGAPQYNGWRIAYRLDLWQSLIGSLFWTDFIGSEFRGGDYADFDEDCAGFAGIRANQLATLLATGENTRWPVGDPRHDVTNGTYLLFHPTDVILLHIGTNDVPDEVTDDVAGILDEIDAYSQHITVVLARIINRAPDGNHGLTTTFNANLNTMAQARIEQGDKILVVDMEDGAGINYNSDMHYSDTGGVDILHPNAAGYTKMAAVWFSELETFMPMSQAPVIESDPVVAVTLGQSYSYDVDASGLPEAVFLLEQSPDGMGFDASTGVITWTPTGTGSFSVRVSATNWVDSDTQNFTVVVSAASVVPVASDDSYGPISDGGTLSITAGSGVLDNDTVSGGLSLTAILANAPAHGLLSLEADGSFVYTHDGSEAATDSFTYRASDGTLTSELATVTIQISLGNDVPVITGQEEIVIAKNGSVTIELADLTVVDSNDTYPGSFTLDVDDGGNYSRDGATITASEDFTGTLTVPVSVNDGQADSAVFQMEILVTPTGEPPPPPSDGGSGGGGCFIQTTGADNSETAHAPVVLGGLLMTLTGVLFSFQGRKP